VRLFRLIDAEKANYPVSLLCRVLKVSRSGYYDLGRIAHPPKETAKMPPSPRRSGRSTSVAEGSMVTPEFMLSSELWECAVTASGSLD
jgi:hypothetical protein